MVFSSLARTSCLGNCNSGLLHFEAKNKSYALKVHIIAMVLSYYLLIGGAINEAFLHIPYLSQFFLGENLSPLDVSHVIALVFFVLLILKYLVKYWSNIFPNK